MSRSPLNFLRFALLLLITSGCAWFNAGEPMFPTITLDQSLDSFVSGKPITPDVLVNTAQAYVQQQVGSKGEILLGFVVAHYQCHLIQCDLTYMSVEFYVNPIDMGPTIFGDDRFTSINVSFFYDLSHNTVESDSYPSRRFIALHPNWQDLPISLETAKKIALERVDRTKLKNLPYYRLGFTLNLEGWEAYFYYSDPDNRKSKADKTIIIPLKTP